MNNVLKTILILLAFAVAMPVAEAHVKKDTNVTKTKAKKKAIKKTKATTKSKAKKKKKKKRKKKAKVKAVPAKQLFGKLTAAAIVPAHVYGSYTKGCFAGGKQLAEDGPAWQAMRLSRNRNWGHPRTIAYIEQLAKDAKAHDGWSGLLVGDISQPRGGPMLTGHASHQLGLDADVWLLQAPKKRLTVAQREKISAISVLTKNKKEINPKIWTPEHLKLLRRAASYKNVARIFINPVIKKKLCKDAGKNRKWLRKLRPWRGHHYHFHVRLNCPKGDRICKNQPAPGVGDGCGADLAKWFKKPKKKKRKKGYKFKFIPKPELTMANLPRACRKVLKQK